MVGSGQPELTWAQSYTFLVLYVLGAISIAVATWNDWWLDARLAVLTHGIDMAIFTGIAFSSSGTTSPFTLFFTLPLLSAAVRWSWRETALTATVLIILFMIAGFAFLGSSGFELQRFVLRAANLFSLTLLLIWFGIHQRAGKTFLRIDDFEAGVGAQDNPLAQALSFTMDATGAGSGALLIGPIG